MIHPWNLVTSAGGSCLRHRIYIITHRAIGDMLRDVSRTASLNFQIYIRLGQKKFMFPHSSHVLHKAGGNQWPDFRVKEGYLSAKAELDREIADGRTELRLLAYTLAVHSGRVEWVCIKAVM
jgi:hypothetical protein